MILIITEPWHSVSELVSTDIVDSKPIWLSTSTYGLNDVVRPPAGWGDISTDARHYKCIQAPCQGVHPFLDTNSALYWLDIGPTDVFAMFDTLTNTTSERANSLTVTFVNAGFSGLSILGIMGASVTVSVNFMDSSGMGGLTYRYAYTLPTPYAYPVVPYNLVLTDIPTARGSGSLSGGEYVITVVISGNVLNELCAIGTIARGTVQSLGEASYGCTLGIVDYSQKKTNSSTGNTVLVPGPYAKKMTVSATFPNSALSRVFDLLAFARASPCMWVAADPSADPVGIFNALKVFGFYRDFTIDTPYLLESTLSTTVEGIV